MLVGKRMTRNPVTIGQEDYLSQALEKMTQGAFRRLPVVEDGKLLGIVTDRDLRQHTGYLDMTKVNAAMTEKLVAVGPQTTLEEAAKLLLKHKFGGLPVVEEGQLVGIITVSDVLQAFLDVMGASEEGAARIDLLVEGQERNLGGASSIIEEAGGEILGVGTYREPWKESPVFYLRLRSPDSKSIAQTLKDKGFTVLGVQP